MNLAFVVTSIFFFSAALTVPTTNEFLLLFCEYLFIGIAFALAPALFFGGLTVGSLDLMPLILLGIEAAQFIFVITRGTVAGGSAATAVLASAPILQIIALLIGTATPIKSTFFHIISSGGGFAIYTALMLVGSDNPTLVFDVQTILDGPSTTHTEWFILGAAVAGWTAMMQLAPKVYQNFRSEMSYYAWSLLYYLLVGSPSQPRPFRLSEVFADDEKPRLITVEPYGQQHPYEMNPSIGIPAIAK